MTRHYEPVPGFHIEVGTFCLLAIATRRWTVLCGVPQRHWVWGHNRADMGYGYLRDGFGLGPLAVFFRFYEQEGRAS